MPDTFEHYLENYADLAVQVGVNVQPGQLLIIRAPIETAPLVRLMAASAYRRGAKLVDVMWIDDELTLSRFKYAPRDSFTAFPTWRTDGLVVAAKEGAAFLSISANDPDLLKGQDPDLIAQAEQTANEHQAEYRAYPMRDAVNWCVISVPIAAWANRVFPDVLPEERVAQLWDAIFNVCRLKEADPVDAWHSHIKNLADKSNFLNNKQYQALKLIGPGTDLTVGLPANHVWKGGQTATQSGIKFVPNLPTDEVFTMPHKDHVNGVVRASKPLNYGGSVIENFTLTFEQGKVVKAVAEHGETTLNRLLDTDEGVRRLGEIALVPASAPVSQAGFLFYNTLFDENAASHLALGQAYRFTLQDGPAMSKADFQAAGGNISLTHVDFMMGSAQMDVDGIMPNGTVEPLMRAGEWAT